MGVAAHAKLALLFAIASSPAAGALSSHQPAKAGEQTGDLSKRQCSLCRIRLVPVTTLRGSGDSVLLDERGPVVRDRDGNFVVWTSERGRIAKFDRAGRLIRVFGRSGAGPGEFSTNFGPLLPLPDGRLAVFEAGAVSIFSPDLNFETRLRQPIRVMGNPIAISARTIVVPGLLLSTEATGHPLHVMDIVDGAISSFGADARGSDTRKCSACMTRHLAQPDTHGRVWVARHRSFQLEHWQYRQRVRQTVLNPVAPWFPEAIGASLESGELAANSTIPVVRALWRDSSDRLFVLGGAPADGKVQRQRTLPRGAVSPTQDDEGVMRKEVIDVIDSRTGIRLTTLELKAPPYYKSLGNGYLAYTEEDEEGAVSIRIIRVVLAS